MVVLARTDGESYLAGLHDQVMVGGRDEDLAGHQPVSVLGLPGGQRARAGEDAAQRARRAGRHVQDDAHGGGEIVRKGADEPPERLDPSGRRADDDDVAPDALLGLFADHRPRVRRIPSWNSTNAVPCQSERTTLASSAWLRSLRSPNDRRGTPGLRTATCPSSARS